MYRVFGFTLIELLVVLALITLLMMFAIPGYKNIVANNRAVTQVNLMATALNFARSEAMRRHGAVTLCPSFNGQSCGGEWREGWIIFSDKAVMGTIKSSERILRVYPAIPPRDKLEWHGARSNHYLQISPAGDMSGQNGTFIYCTQAEAIPQVIIINQAGRIRVEQGRDAEGQPLRCN